MFWVLFVYLFLSCSKSLWSAYVFYYSSICGRLNLNGHRKSGRCDLSQHHCVDSIFQQCGQQTSSAPNELCVQAERSRIVAHLSWCLSAPFVCLAQSPCEFRRAAIDGALDGGVWVTHQSSAWVSCRWQDVFCYVGNEMSNDSKLWWLSTIWDCFKLRRTPRSV